MDKTKIIQDKIDAIEVEMKRLGMWKGGPIPEVVDASHEAFGAGVLSPDMWLEYVFVPRVRDSLKSNGPWPTESNVSSYMVKNLEGEEYQTLRGLLSDFDQLFQA